MQVLKVAIAGFGGVGRATADLLLSRRERYRRLYGTDVRLVAVCGSKAGLADAEGLEPDRLDALELGLTGPDFVAASGAAVLIEAGPSDYRTGGIPHNTMSSHLGILQQAGLVRSQRQGRSVIYAANLLGVRDLLAFLLEDCCQGRREICAPLLDAVLPACCGDLPRAAS